MNRPLQARLSALEAHAEHRRHAGTDPEAAAVEVAALFARIREAGPFAEVEGYGGNVPLIQRSDSPERASELYQRTCEARA